MSIEQDAPKSRQRPGDTPHTGRLAIAADGTTPENPTTLDEGIKQLEESLAKQGLDGKELADAVAKRVLDVTSRIPE